LPVELVAALRTPTPLLPAQRVRMPLDRIKVLRALQAASRGVPRPAPGGVAAPADSKAAGEPPLPFRSTRGRGLADAVAAVKPRVYLRRTEEDVSAAAAAKAAEAAEAAAVAAAQAWGDFDAAFAERVGVNVSLLRAYRKLFQPRVARAMGDRAFEAAQLLDKGDLAGALHRLCHSDRGRTPKASQVRAPAE
jgi:hypothetical protein